MKIVIELIKRRLWYRENEDFFFFLIEIIFVDLNNF